MLVRMVVAQERATTFTQLHFSGKRGFAWPLSSLQFIASTNVKNNVDDTTHIAGHVRTGDAHRQSVATQRMHGPGGYQGTQDLYQYAAEQQGCFWHHQGVSR